MKVCTKVAIGRGNILSHLPVHSHRAKPEKDHDGVPDARKEKPMSGFLLFTETYRLSLVIRPSFFLPKQFQKSRSVL